MTRTTKTGMSSQKTSRDVEVGLAELSGVAICAFPGCTRQLPPGKGRQVGTSRQCFGHEVQS
jgi:hypothetical protein